MASGQRTYIRGRTANMRGPRRVTVADPDEVAVERFVAGDRTLTLAKVERDAAIDRLDGRGLSAAQVAVQLGVTQRTVQRRRSERRRAALLQSLLRERYGATDGLIREAVAAPRPRWAVREEEAAAHRQQLLDSTTQRRRGPGSLPQSRAAVTSPSRTTTDDEGGRVSQQDQPTVRPGTDKTGEAGR